MPSEATRPDHPVDARRLLRNGRLALAALAALAALSTACSATPAPSAAPATTPPGDRGAAVYAERCASCHGADLRGTTKGPSHLSKVYEPGHHGDEAFRQAIARGSRQHHWSFGDMAPVAGLNDADVAAVIAFVRAEQQRRGFEPYPPR